MCGENSVRGCVTALRHRLTDVIFAPNAKSQSTTTRGTYVHENSVKVAIICEESGTVRDAFRKRGHDAWSYDLLPGRGLFPQYHVQGDITKVPKAKLAEFDLAICHPPCDRLLVAGALHWKKWQASGEQQKGIEFFMFMTRLPIKKIAIENPVGIMSTAYRKSDQIIEPWQFGHPETKRTCLWLTNLPLLQGTKNVYDEMMKLPPKLRNRVHHESPGVRNGLTRSMRRAVTYPGWADAMVEQWGSL